MNVRTALISSALLLAVVGWACEQQGPTSPSALGTPGGGSLGAAGVSLDAPGGVRLASCKNDPDQPKCRDSRQLYEVTFVRGTDIFGGPGVTRAVRGDSIIVDTLKLNLPFFENPGLGLTERDGTACNIERGEKTVRLGMGVPSADPDVMNVNFSFPHEGTQHRIGLLGTVPATWPPTSSTFLDTVKQLTAATHFFDWTWSVSVDKKNKNNPKVCTGEGFGITWEIEVKPCGVVPTQGECPRT